MDKKIAILWALLLNGYIVIKFRVFQNILRAGLYSTERYCRSLENPIMAVYTVIVGQYDLPLVHKYKNPYCDYICFTDTPELFEGKSDFWEFRKLEFNSLDNARNSRYPKIMPHLFLPEYDESLYVDANVDILTSKVFKDIQNAKDKNTSIAVSKHWARNCIYDEADEIIKNAIDDPETVSSQVASYRDEGFPSKWGLGENNIIYRKHNDPLVKSVMQQWWELVEGQSKRDQLGLAYLLWRNNLPLRYINDLSCRMDIENYWIPGDHGEGVQHVNEPYWLEKHRPF